MWTWLRESAWITRGAYGLVNALINLLALVDDGALDAVIMHLVLVLGGEGVEAWQSQRRHLGRGRRTGDVGLARAVRLGDLGLRNDVLRVLGLVVDLES